MRSLIVKLAVLVLFMGLVSQGNDCGLLLLLLSLFLLLLLLCVGVGVTAHVSLPSLTACVSVSV
jgi:hypothetical protein